MRSINLVTRENGVGLSRNILILSRVLREAGFRVTVNGLRPSVPFRLYCAAVPRLRRRRAFDVNLFIQFVAPQWFDYARINCLIPNQEWFDDEWLCYLGRLDWVLCKTRHAQDIFEKLGCRTEFISFTSLDRYDPTSAQAEHTFFHLAGHSLQKGTDALVRLWLRHPEWPRLRIVQDPHYAQPVAARNIELIVEYVSDEVLRRYQNEHGVHLCPSEAEGFGHYIVEAMSCRAVTVTTDAPPMNEIVNAERGVLINYRAAEMQRLGIRYYVDISVLEQKIESLLSTSAAARKRLGEAARDWYQENDRFFRRKIVEVLNNI